MLGSGFCEIQRGIVKWRSKKKTIKTLQNKGRLDQNRCNYVQAKCFSACEGNGVLFQKKALIFTAQAESVILSVICLRRTKDDMIPFLHPFSAFLFPILSGDISQACFCFDGDVVCVCVCVLALDNFTWTDKVWFESRSPTSPVSPEKRRKVCDWSTHKCESLSFLNAESVGS